MESVPSSDNEREQLSQVLEQIQSHYEIFLEFQEKTEKARQRFSREKDITSTQCSRATKDLLLFDDQIQTFWTFLTHPQLPESIGQHRHKILMRLDNITTSTYDLKNCVKAFTPSSSAEEAKIKREEISSFVQTLENNLLCFNKLLKSMLDILSLVSQADYKETSNQLSKTTDAEEQDRIVIFPPSSPSAAHETTIASETAKLPQFNHLYTLLANHTTALDFQEICLNVSFLYNRLEGDSHAERALSLVTQLDNQMRLADLEKELRRLLPNRFSDAPPLQ